MTKLNSLIFLINSLTKGEKRYFKLSSGLQQGPKDYLHLFEIIDKGVEIQAIKKAFLRKKPSASLDITCKYLHKLILDAMFHIRVEKNISLKLTTHILKVNILFEKGLYEDGFDKLQKIQVQAEKSELHAIQLWAANLELDYICNLNFHAITEAKLVQKQMKVQKLLKYAQHIHQHNSLYQLLHHRLLYKGYSRTKQQKEELNDLLVSELSLVSKPIAETFESKKTHLLFQANYFISVSDYKLALSTFYELNQLFEDNVGLWTENPTDYLTAIEGILDSLRTIKRYREMVYFIEKLDRPELSSGYHSITTLRIVYTYTVIGLIDNGQFDKAILVDQQFEDKLFKNVNLLNLSAQAELYLYKALIYFGSGSIDKAKNYLNRILLESTLYYTLPVYRTFRLIHLLVHFELGNHDYIKYEIRSIKRNFSLEGQNYLLEKVIFKFVSLVELPTQSKDRIKLSEKMSVAFEKTKKDKYQIQLLKIFNFEAWIEAKLLKKPFSALLVDGKMVSEAVMR